MLRSPYFIS